MGLMKGWMGSGGSSQPQKVDVLITLTIAGAFQTHGDWTCSKEPSVCR